MLAQSLCVCVCWAVLNTRHSSSSGILLVLTGRRRLLRGPSPLLSSCSPACCTPNTHESDKFLPQRR